MWRPLGVFLYDWWPTRNEARLSDRLAVMPIRIRYANAIFVRTGGFNTSVVVGVARYGQAVIDPHGECATIQYPDEDQVYVVLEGSGSVQYDLMFIGDSVGFNPGG